MIKMPDDTFYPYLSTEDANFAKAFRLSEDTILKLFGGLHGYKLHMLRREDVRRQGHTVKPLTTELTKETLEQMERLRLSEEQVAEVVVNDQVKQVQSLVDLEKAQQRLEEFHRSNR
jgi:hypothetical protein